MEIKSKKILIVDAGCLFNGSGATLNHTLSEKAAQQLRELGHDVTITTVDRDFDPEEEALKLANADSVIIQFPGWWMGAPWQLKRWIDLVFMTDTIKPNDGRSRHDHTRLYGTGGIFTGAGKTYMLSSTWNAPVEAFDDPIQFFGGRGIEEVLLPLHKAFQFIGFRPVPSFMINDVFKNPTITVDFERFAAHLNRYFGA